MPQQDSQRRAEEHGFLRGSDLVFLWKAEVRSPGLLCCPTGTSFPCALPSPEAGSPLQQINNTAIHMPGNRTLSLLSPHPNNGSSMTFYALLAITTATTPHQHPSWETRGARLWLGSLHSAALVFHSPSPKLQLLPLPPVAGAHPSLQDCRALTKVGGNQPAGPGRGQGSA